MRPASASACGSPDAGVRCGGAHGSSSLVSAPRLARRREEPLRRPGRVRGPRLAWLRGMNTIELELALLAVVPALVWAAQRVGVPYPILLVLGGLGIGYLPGVPSLEVDPEIIFLVFLPPLVHAAGYRSSPRELKANAGPDRPALGGPGDRHHRRGGRRRPRAGARPELAGGPGARGHRVAHRHRGRRVDLPPPGRARAGGDDPGGREPDQRRHRPGALPRRAGRRGRRQPLGGRLPARPVPGRPGRRGVRPGRRVPRPPGAPPPRRPARRDRGDPADPLPGLRPGGAARAVRHPGRGGQRRVPGLVALGDHLARHAPAVRRVLGGLHLPARVDPVRAHRPAGADRARRPGRPLLAGAGPVGGAGQPGRDRDPGGLGVRRHLPPPAALAAIARRARTRTGATSPSSPGRGCAARCRWPRPWPSR